MDNKVYSIPLLLFLSLIQIISIASYHYDEERLPTFLSASVGEHVVFNCEVEFPQDIEIRYILNWRKDDKIIFSWDNGVITSSDPYVGRIQLVSEVLPGYGKASINLTSIRESDAGWYECKIIFPYRTPTSLKNGTWFYLDVNGGNLLEIPPINQTVMEGDDVRFTCIAKELGVEIRWFKDGRPLQHSENIFRRSRIDNEGSLTIHATEMGDSGEYICEANNYVSESQSARAFLDVQYKAKVVYAPKEVYLPFGQPAILNCEFYANPPLKSLRWEKDGFLFDPYNVPGVFYRQNGSLYFNRIDESHNGHYTCTPYNDLGTEGPSPSTHVIVLRPPVFVTTPHQINLRRLGESVELVCDARDGENGHKPIIVWFKKDGSMPEGRYTIRDGNLTITNIQEDDRGLYQCSATNEAATITAETELLVENVPPRAPHNLTAKAFSNSIRLSWVAGRKRPRIKYSVWYRSVESSEWKKVEVRGALPLEVTVFNLKPNQEYEFMVLSEDPHGEAVFSKPLRSWTLGFGIDPTAGLMESYSPLASPLNISVKLIDGGCLVSWDMPAYGIDYLEKFIVRWYESSEGTLYGSLDTTNTSYLVTDLEEGNSYDFQVTAIAIDGYESVSTRITISVPAYHKIKILSMSLIAVVAFLIVAMVAIYYIKTKCFPSYSKQANNTQK